MAWLGLAAWEIVEGHHAKHGFGNETADGTGHSRGFPEVQQNMTTCCWKMWDICEQRPDGPVFDQLSNSVDRPVADNNLGRYVLGANVNVVTPKPYYLHRQQTHISTAS